MHVCNLQVTFSIIFVYSISLSLALYLEKNNFSWQTTLWVIESVDWRPWISDVAHSDPCSVRRSFDLTPPILWQPSRHQLKVPLLQVCPTNKRSQMQIWNSWWPFGLLGTMFRLGAQMQIFKLECCSFKTWFGSKVSLEIHLQTKSGMIDEGPAEYS